jgi:hypothetical protein
LWISGQESIYECKSNVIMSPLSKVEMSPLLGFMAWEVLYGGTNTNEH